MNNRTGLKALPAWLGGLAFVVGMAVTIAVTIAVTVTACGTPKNTIVVGSKPFTESYILSEMLSQLIEKKLSLKVERKFGIAGGTANIQPALLKGDIDLYPEYTGTGWEYVLKMGSGAGIADLYDKVKAEYLGKFKLVWLDRYGFNDTYTLALTEARATELGVKSFSDLAPHSGTLTFGAEHDFYERNDGYDALSKAYGFAFKSTKQLDIGLKYKAIGQGLVDVINAFSTDGLLLDYKLKVLKDDKNFFPAYDGATIVRQDTLKKFPKLGPTLDLLAGQINNDEMTHMNWLVDSQKKDPAEVASEFLKSKGLIE